MMKMDMYRKFSLSVLTLIFALMSVGIGGSVSLAQPIPLPGGNGNAMSAGRNLFIPASEAQVRGLTTRPEQVGTERSMFAALNYDALSLANASRNTGQVLNDPGILLNLFDDVTYTAINSKIEPRQLNRPGYVWYGHIPAVPFSNVVMVVGDNGQISAQVLIPGKNYYIDSAGNGLYRISQINTYEQRGYEDFINVTPTEAEIQQVRANQRSPRADDGSIVDVMVVYTPKAATFLGGVENMEFAIENVVALSNLTYDNSEVGFHLRLVHTEQVDYVEEPFTDLDVLDDPNDGIIDNVHTLRDQYKADLVTLIPGNSAEDRAYCGIANLPTNLPAPTTGFSVVEALCISDITYPHELGHNMGKAHDPANAGGAVHPYAYGYQDVASPPGQDWGDFVTVMAYSTDGECPSVYQPGVCPAVAWWSNPDLTYDGKPLGTADQNNALSLNQTALDIANYRISDDGGLSTPTPTRTPTATSTPTSTPDPGVTATPTVLAPVELILNGGFEYDADGDGTPDAWSSSKAKARKCGDVGVTDDCAILLKGKPGIKPKLVQTILNGETLLVSDQLTFAAQAKGKGVPDGEKLQLKVKYIDPTAGTDSNGKDVITLLLPTGDYAYTALEGNVTVQSEVKKVKVLLKYGAASGKVTIDDVSLEVLPAALIGFTR